MIQKSTSLKYEPASEPLNSTPYTLNLKPYTAIGQWRQPAVGRHPDNPLKSRGDRRFNISRAEAFTLDPGP